jgi:CHAD domain-containing protein
MDTKVDKMHLSVRLRRQVAILHGGLDRAAAALEAAPTPAAIHATRVAARRLRVLLQTYSQELNSKRRKQYRRELKELTSTLAPAREAEVARRLILRLTGNRRADRRGDCCALYESAQRRCESEVGALRAAMADTAWRQRLMQLRRLSEAPSLVRENSQTAAKAMQRLVKQRRRRLRAALSDAGSNPEKLHRIRLKIKAMRYLLEACLSKNAIEKDRELRRLRRIQNCLGDLHDGENLIKALRTERTHRMAALLLREKLERRKHRQLQAFKKQRKALTRLWDSTV